jgi:hypothetical protein
VDASGKVFPTPSSSVAVAESLLSQEKRSCKGHKITRLPKQTKPTRHKQNYKKKRTNTIIMLVVRTKNAVRSLFLIMTVVVLAKTTLAQVRFEAIVSGFARSFRSDRLPCGKLYMLVPPAAPLMAHP